MHEEFAVAIAVIIGTGVASQWLAAALKVPSVLVLLPAGLLVGPVLGLLKPEDLFGDALFPLIAISVGLVLFEGGFGLRLEGARSVRRPVAGLVTIGLVLTWLVGGAAATLLFEVPASVGFLLGAVLVVSGPTVIIPLLDVVRLRERVASILRWECIVIDPIGAVLAVAIFEATLDVKTGFNPISTLSASAAVGVATGILAGFGLALLLKFQALPDRLHNSATLALVIGCFVTANLLSVEAGLFATTVMGVVLVNQRIAPVAHIAAFGEDLAVLVLGALFIVLGATADLAAIGKVLIPAVGLLVVLLSVRPLAVWISTIGAGLQSKERWYLSLIAPRGVVAASVGTLFAVSLKRDDVAGAEYLAPATFVVIIGSVLFASIVARPAARSFRVAAAEPRGVLLAGSQPWMLAAGEALARHDVPVLIAGGESSGAAARAGLLSFTGSLDTDELRHAISAVGVGVAVIGTDDDAVTSYMVEKLSETLGRRNVYRVASADGEALRRHSRSWGRLVFANLNSSPEPRELDIVAIPSSKGDADIQSDLLPLFVVRKDEPPTVVVRWRGPVDGIVIAARSVPALSH